MPWHRIARAGYQSHRQLLTGIVVNRKLNVRRRSYDELKAILHNCAREGAASQNRDRLGDFRAHLAGRIEYLEHLDPAKGRKLRAAFERIEWS